ncbi:MAG: hypothetical protein IAF08_12990 [Rhizobacter sp.]|nr:hypothetical protein [Chlorobiales bacterium]
MDMQPAGNNSGSNGTEPDVASTFEEHRSNLTRTIDEKQKDLFAKVDGVKDSLEDAFNVEKIMRENPVATVSVAAVLGFTASRMISGRRANNGLAGYIISKVSGIAFGAIAGYALREVRKIIAVQSGSQKLERAKSGASYSSAHTSETPHRLGASPQNT